MDDIYGDEDGGEVAKEPRIEAGNEGSESPDGKKPAADGEEDDTERQKKRRPGRRGGRGH